MEPSLHQTQQNQLSSILFGLGLLISAGRQHGLALRRVRFASEEFWKRELEQVDPLDSISHVMERSIVFPPFVQSLVRVGEGFGDLGPLLITASRIIGREARYSTMHKPDQQFLTALDFLMVAHILDCGRSLPDAIRGVIKHGSESNREAFTNILRSVERGSFLSDAMSRFCTKIEMPGHAPLMKTYMVSAEENLQVLRDGESAGDVVPAMRSLADTMMRGRVGVEVFFRTEAK